MTCLRRRRASCLCCFCKMQRRDKKNCKRPLTVREATRCLGLGLGAAARGSGALACGEESAALNPQALMGYVWTAPGKNFLTFCSIGRVRSRVRPVGAAGMAAGPNALRGSVPKQKRALNKRCVDPSGFSRSPEHRAHRRGPIGAGVLGGSLSGLDMTANFSLGSRQFSVEYGWRSRTTLPPTPGIATARRRRNSRQWSIAAAPAPARHR
jgi:hypothetical protein